MGAEGAVIGTIASEGAVCIYQAFKVRHELPVMKYIFQYVKYLIPGVIMYVLLRVLINSMSYSVIHLLEAVLMGMVVYLVIFLAYMILFERKQLYAIMNRVKRLIKM